MTYCVEVQTLQTYHHANVGNVDKTESENLFILFLEYKPDFMLISVLISDKDKRNTVPS